MGLERESVRRCRWLRHLVGAPPTALAVLGEFEQMILLAMAPGREDVNGSQIRIRKEMELSAGRQAAQGGFRTTLFRFERNKYLRRAIRATDEGCGGMPQRHFKLNSAEAWARPETTAAVCRPLSHENVRRALAPRPTVRKHVQCSGRPGSISNNTTTLKTPVEYHRPASVPEACQLLLDLGLEALPLAGGTDVLVDLRRGSKRPQHLVSLGDLQELREMVTADDEWRIGALVTPAQLEASESVRSIRPELLDAVGRD